MIIGKKIKDEIYDLHENNLETCSSFENIYRNSLEGEFILRHSAAHLLATAIKILYKNVQFAIGPVTENGFYYDFLINENISFYDLEKIENIMHSLVKEKYLFKKNLISLSSAKEFFKNDICKLEILKNIEGNITTYEVENFIDLCKGPHVINSEIIGNNFKLIKISQINWKNMLLQRIEGILFYSEERLNNFLKNLEEKKFFDHKKIGEELELFKQINVSKGNIFWLENGNILFQKICRYLEEKYEKYNYKLVKTPLIFQENLWKNTGHLDKYKDNMYITNDNQIIKPMNCPGHVEIFKILNVSYRNLPIRIGEIAHVHRKEETGALNCLKRAIGFHQDDGHIFCDISHIENEIENFMHMLKEIYQDFGFTKYKIVVSTKPENSIGDEKIWAHSEETIFQWLKKNSYEFIIKNGDGAFYGPKIEIVLLDNLEREWTCGTLQWDNFLPERLKAKYIDINNKKIVPIMLHRAILGSIERFIAILLESYKGDLPLWLVPIPIGIISISKEDISYCQKIANELKLENFKFLLDIEDIVLGNKIKKFLIKKIPIIIIIGKKEIENSIISLRYKNKNYKLSLNKFLKILKSHIFLKKIEHINFEKE